MDYLALASDGDGTLTRAGHMAKAARGALERLQAITPPGMQARIHVTLTDEYPMAEAFVIISAEPADASADTSITTSTAPPA